MMQESGALFGLSLIFLLVGKGEGAPLTWCPKLSSIFYDFLSCAGSQCLPVQRRQALQQPEWCRQHRPTSSKDSPCADDDTVRRYFFHETKLRGCKKFGICSNDSAIYDDETEIGIEQINYFLTYEECQKQCMQREWLLPACAHAAEI